jgi:hypothetical protein
MTSRERAAKVTADDVAAAQSKVKAALGTPEFAYYLREWAQAVEEFAAHNHGPEAVALYRRALEKGLS